VALTVAVGTALASATFFGVSLALGAFVAGVVVSESPFSHQISADLLPFREAFAVIFFVSIGMLVNPVYLLQHWDQVLLLTVLIVVVKGLISFAISVVLPASARTSLVLATGRGQIGEFSFIVGQTGMALGLIDTLQYSLILAGGIVSIMVNPFVVRLVEPLERRFKSMPAFWRWLNRHGIPDLPDPGHMQGHVVIVGSGRVGRHIAEALGRLNIPRLIIEADPVRLERLVELGVPVLYGDAGSSEILHHAGLEHAIALVVTLPDDATVLAVAVDARRQAPNLRIIARASTWDGARRLRQAGVDEIVRPELEGGLEIVRRTLLDLDMPTLEVQRYTELVRREDMQETNLPSAARLRVLDDIVVATHSLEIGWIIVPADSPMAGRTLADTALRSTIGVTVVAIGRGDQLHVNPGRDDVMLAGDRIAVIGTPAQVGAAEKLFAPPPPVVA
jgi:CPA2 family monovalent cation:H+ antiporter-2